MGISSKNKLIKLAALLFLARFFCCAVNLPVYGEQVSVKDLLEFPQAYDGKILEIQGEAIGEVLKSRRGFWINISSDQQAIGVFSPARGIFSPVKHWGGYRKIGDRVKVTGTFFKDFPEGASSAIYAEKLKVVEQGYEEKRQVAGWKKKLAAFLLPACLLSGIIYFLRIRHGRKV